jgi:hypothetical protein
MSGPNSKRTDVGTTMRPASEIASLIHGHSEAEKEGAAGEDCATSR